MSNSNTLVFQSHTLITIEHENQLWLRGNQIGEALGYAKPEISVINIYNRHSDEFPQSMTRLIKVETTGGQQEVRVFSLRGCHLIAMFAKTPIAKAFRKWVLDILDAEAAKAPSIPSPTLTPEQQRFVQKVVAAKTKDIVNRDRAFAHIYHHLKEHFHVAKYSQIPAERFEEAVNMIERMELSYLEKYTDARITEVESAALVYVIEKSAEMADAIRVLSPLAVRAGQKLPLIAQQ